MSVINQMLKDVDKRSSQPQSDSLVGQVVNVPTAEKFSSATFIVMIICSVLIIATFFFYRLLTAPAIEQTTDVASLQVAVQTATNDPEPTLVDNSSNHQSPNSLKAITKAVVDDGASVEQVRISEQHQLVSEPIMPVPVKAEAKVIKNAVEPTPKASVIKTAPKLTVQQEAEAFYQQAVRAINQGNLALAERLLNTALSFSKKHHASRLLQFKVLGDLSKDFMPLLDQAINSYPAVYQYRLFKARLLLEQDKLEAAKQLLDSNLPLLAEAPDYFASLAYIAQQQSNYALAAEYYQQLLQQNASRSDWWLGLGIANQQQGKNVASLQAYQQAIMRGGLAESLRVYANQQIKLLQGS